jgi:hypothetical protein
VKSLILALLTLLLGCDPVPTQKTIKSSNPTVTVGLFFEVDGCKVYRFKDGDYHYFVKCVGSDFQTTADYKGCGKDCAKPEEIPTVKVTP